jgi:hypothetical protein
MKVGKNILNFLVVVQNKKIGKCKTLKVLVKKINIPGGAPAPPHLYPSPPLHLTVIFSSPLSYAPLALSRLINRRIYMKIRSRVYTSNWSFKLLKQNPTSLQTLQKKVTYKVLIFTFVFYKLFKVCQSIILITKCS